MSPTSNPEVDALLERGAASGMPAAEASRWREMLDPRALDTCGCVAAAQAATVAGLASLPFVALSRRKGTAVAWSAAITLAAAALGSITGRRQAVQSRDRLMDALNGRVFQLEQPGKETPTESQA
jgi:hypothetical protein